jgi:2-methylfumaryl-CoA isomerase
VLNGLRVVEISSFVAAPTAGLTLAQLGAEVIRVDPVGGAPDVARWPVTDSGRSIYWAGLNRGKASVVADLRSAEGQRAVYRLLRSRDGEGGILVTNLSGKTWLSDEALRAKRPDLIHVRVLGRRDGRSAVDYTVNAASGLAYATGTDPGSPTNNALPAWDLLCGMYAAVAVLAAVTRRRQTGAGSYATVALEDVAASVLTTLGFLPEAQITSVSRPPLGNSIYGSFGAEMALADGSRIMVVALTPRQWADLVEVTGTRRLVDAVQAELGVDFADEGARFTHRDLLVALVRPWFAARSLAEAGAALGATSVLWAPFRTLVEHARDLVAGAAEPVVSVRRDDGLGAMLATAGPIRRPREAPPTPGSAPTLGQHSATWLSAESRDGLVG